MKNIRQEAILFALISILSTGHVNAEVILKGGVGHVFNARAGTILGTHNSLEDVLGEAVINPFDTEPITAKGTDLSTNALSAYTIAADYYFNQIPFLGLNASYTRNKLKMNEFQTVLQNADGVTYDSDQPPSTMKMHLFGFGPILRYTANGQRDNKIDFFASPQIVYMWGSATGADFSLDDDLYGRTGKTAMNGWGYGVNAGVNYRGLHKMVYGLEYRYTKIDNAKIDRFRSFMYNGAKTDFTFHAVYFTVGREF